MGSTRMRWSPTYNCNFIFVRVADACLENVTITQGSGLVKIFHDAQTASGFHILRYFCSECGSNLFMRSGNNSSTEMGLKILSYGCMDLEEGDGRWRE